ncbi:ogr/Delta-like zinc finger family protein [Ferrimonas senticii]|uniref:ogr/Delta-like zinc finger family protein n=1 Tax=Ferrimonas senticii TaxID=394566 RepID=UPI000403A176|nr:ogr/Delta-like zinc finger family protein [Ferrimonas senticii]
MRVTCKECGEKARIQSTSDAIPGYAKMYCCCTNPHCGHTFVAEWSYRHTLNPGLQANQRVLVDLVRAMPAEQMQLFINQVTA